MDYRETHDLGRLYCHGMRYPAGQWPIVDLGSSHEVDEPWRLGRCLVLRLPLSRVAAVIGWWGKPRTYEELLEAEQAAERDAHEPLTVETLRTWEPPLLEATDSEAYVVRRAQ